MRISDLRNLQWRDVDLPGGLLTLDHNKTDQPRVWKLDDGVTESLRRWSRLLSPAACQAGYIIVNPQTGKRIPTGKAAARLRRALQVAGITRQALFESTDVQMPIRGHDLRSTFVTISLAQGKTEAWVTDRAQVQRHDLPLQAGRQNTRRGPAGWTRSSARGHP